MLCSACRRKPELGKSRYICLICKSSPLIDVKNMNGFIELCENCMQKYLDDDDESVSEALESDNHKKDHLWLRVLYNTEDYYKYWTTKRWWIKRNLLKINVIKLKLSLPVLQYFRLLPLIHKFLQSVQLNGF